MPPGVSPRCRIHRTIAFNGVERERLRERTLLGLDRARAQRKQLGPPVDESLRERIAKCSALSVRDAARRVGCSTTTVQKVRKLLAG
jgi:DNA invertase Pin-like site-specific DNA recombinase